MSNSQSLGSHVHAGETAPMMWLVPFTWFTIEVPFDVDEARARLARITGPERGWWQEMTEWWRRDKGNHSFVGTIGNEDFEIRRDIRYSNAFLPILSGHLSSRADGTHVSVTFALRPVFAAALVIWFALAGQHAYRNGLGEGADLLPLGMLLFGWLLCQSGFVPEAIIAKRLLRRALLEECGDDAR